MRKAPLVPLAVLVIVLLAVGQPLLLYLDTGHWTHHCPQPSMIEVLLTETPQPRPRSFRATVKVISIDGATRHGDITLFLRRDSIAASLRYGDKLLLHTYSDTLNRSLYCTSDHYIVTSRDSTSLRARVERWRMHLLQRMRQGPLEPRYAGVAEAMTLGWRGDLDAGLQAAFRDSGIMHLLCVSGLHVGLVAAMVGGLLVCFGRDRRGRRVRGAVQLLAVWGFALLSGLAPSTVRAALMFSLFIVSNILGRRTDSLNLLAAAAIVMLVAKPTLVCDVGWQLSFAAVAGILLARPVIRSFRTRLMRAMVASTAATVATLPIVVATFHRVPLYFLVANLVVVPLAGVLLLLSICYLLIPCTLFAWPLGLLLQVADHLTLWVSGLPYAVAEGVSPSPWGLAAIAAAALALLAAAQATALKKETP